MRACGECIYFRDGAGLRDHGHCGTLDGISVPVWVDEVKREGRALVAVNKCADACGAYCQRARPIGAPHDWTTPYERWLDEHREG